MNPTFSWFEERRHLCMSLLRIYLGVGLLFKGLTFIAEREEVLELVDGLQIPLAGLGLVHYIILAHIGGGALMAVGFATRVGALVQVPVLAGAVFYVHWGGGLLALAEDLRFSALVLFLLLIFVWHGSGALSVDSYWRKEETAK